MKILFLDVSFDSWKTGLFLRHSIFEPLGIEYLASSAILNNHSAKVLNPRITNSEIKKVVNEYNPAVVAFSVLTYNFLNAKSIAEEIKKLNPSIKTIFGGYYPSACPQIVEDENIDYVVIGEGERTLTELLDAFNSERDVSEIKGIAYWDDGLCINKPRERIKDLDELPFPLRDKKILKECKIGGLSFPPPSKQKSACQITYSRGCPYSCIFCSSSQLWGNAVHWRSAGNLMDEIEYLQREFGTNIFFFPDLTFNLNKSKVFELCNEIKKRKVKINWYAMCRLTQVHRDLFIQMKEVGCNKISFGIDSIINYTLAKIKPGQNINIKKIKSTLDLISNLGFIVKAYLMIGYPWEDKESVQTTQRILKTLSIDELRISFLTPFPGTQLFNEFKKEDLLLTEDFSRYTSDEPIIKTKDLSRQELLEFRKSIFKDFYSSEEYEMRKKNKLKKFPYLKQSYYEFFELLHEKELF